MSSAGNIQYRKMTTSMNVTLLKIIDQYAAEHYISRASAIHLLLMEAMKMEDIVIDTTITRITDTVKIVVNVPIDVSMDLDNYIKEHGFKTKTAAIYTLLTAVLSQKGYWEPICNGGKT